MGEGRGEGTAVAHPADPQYPGGFAGMEWRRLSPQRIPRLSVGARTATSAHRGPPAPGTADVAVRAPWSCGWLESPITWGWCARRRCQTLRVKVLQTRHGNVNCDPEPTNRMGRPNPPPQPECCRQPGQAPASTEGEGAERTAGGVHRDRSRPQAGVASGLSHSASKRLTADGEASSHPNPTRGRPLLVRAKPICRGRSAWHGPQASNTTWEARSLPTVPTAGTKSVGGTTTRSAPRGGFGSQMRP